MDRFFDKFGDIVKLRERGLTYRAIGERLGISKVAVYKQLKRKGLTGRVNLINQVRDLQERVNELEKEVEEIKALVISRL